MKQKSAQGTSQVAEVEAKNSDFAWEVLDKCKLKVFGVGHSIGKAAVSCGRGAKNGYTNFGSQSARRRFAEAK